MLEKCQTLDFKELNQDVAAFLFNPNDKRVEKFADYISGLEF